MISGTFSVTSSDNDALAVGNSYPLSIDDTQVDVSVLTATTVEVAALPTDTSDSSDPTDGTSDAGGDTSIVPSDPVPLATA